MNTNLENVEADKEQLEQQCSQLQAKYESKKDQVQHEREEKRYVTT